MEEQKFSFSESFKKIKEYVDTQIELARLRLIAKSSRTIGAVSLDLVKLLLILIISFFFSLAIGFWLGELIGSYALGFLATGGIFLILLIVVIALEPKLEVKLMNLFIRRVLNKWEDEGERVSKMGEDTESENDITEPKEQTQSQTKVQ